MTINYNDQTILIIDDDEDNLNLIAAFLDVQGIKTMIVSNGTDGIDIAKKCHISLILLDICMPVMDGYEACHFLKTNKKTKDTPIIFMSGMIELNEKLKAFALGAVDYITKPVQEPELLARVCVHLQLAQFIKENESRNSRLVDALDVSNVVNVAIGVFMERHHVNRQDAFDIIRKQARSQRRKVDEVADELLTGLDMLNMWVDEQDKKT